MKLISNKSDVNGNNNNSKFQFDHGCFHNRTVRLNGKVLKLVDDCTLPDLLPVIVPGDQPLILPPLSFGLYVIPEASARACR